MRKPSQPPLQGKNAEVWINKDDLSKAITVTSKGVVGVSLYDARGNSAAPLPDLFNYKGLNGLSELDTQFSARTQINVRGQAEFKNDQFKEGIFTNQDGAVIKVNHDNFRPDQADMVRAECFDCAAGEAIIIQKSVAVAKETGVQGVFAGTNRASVRLRIDVDEKGQIIFTPDRQNLGLLASQIQKDGQEVSIGNNLLVSVPCGELECNFKLSRDPRTNELGAAHEFVDPKNPEVSLKRTEYPLTIGKVLGSEAILVSEQNAAEIDRLTVLVEEGKFNELTKLSFGKDDVGYAALKKKFFLESGLNLDAIADPKYARDFETIIKTTQQARETFKKHGIELDTFGNPKTKEDAEKYQKIVNKGLGTDVDELTKAKWDLTRMRVKEVESLLAACQGTSYCSVSEKDLKTAKEEEKKIVGARTANYNRWKALVQKVELEKLQKEADERAKREDKGIEPTDKKELEDAKRKINRGEKIKFDLEQTLKSQRERVNGARATILSKLEQELVGSGKKSIYAAIDLERFNSDPDYVVSLFNKYAASRYFFTDELFSEDYNLRENFRADAKVADETQRKINQLDTDLRALESQNQALIEKYRLDGKDDVAAEVALVAGKYDEVGNILSGPNLATQDRLKEVVKLGEDIDGNVVVVETIDVSVLAGQQLVSTEVAQDFADRAVRQQRDGSLDQVALLYDYGYGNEAGALLQNVVATNPEMAQELDEAKNVPDALLRSDLVMLKKARMAEVDYSKRVLEQRETELEQANLQGQLKKDEEEQGAGRGVARAWEGLSPDVSSVGRLAETSFGFIFDSSEKAAADTLGITKIRDDLDQRAFEEQERQIAQLHSLRFKLKEYETRGLSPAQAFTDARAGLDRGADGKVVSSSSELQISVGDEPAAAMLEFDLTRQVFSEQDKEYLKTIDNPLDRLAFETQRQEEYERERKELEFDVAVRDAENAQRFNRNKLAGEPAAKYKEALAVCSDCAGAKSVQQNLDTLDQNILGGVIAVYTGEEVGELAARGLEKVGVTYTRETEEEFRDMIISSFDALAVFDVAEAVIGAPLALVDTLQKLRKISKTVDAAGTAIEVYRFASKGSREAFAAAKAAERAADTVEAAAEARKAVNAVKAALDAEIKAGQQASKYQKFKRALDTPLGKFDRDVAKARNVEIDAISAQTQNLNLAQRELETARISGDALAEGQSLVKISDAREIIGQSAQNIDELDDLLRVSKIAGSNGRVVRTAWDATLGKVFGDGPGEEILTSEKNFRIAADDFAEASANARLVGDTPEAVLSRARLDAAKEKVELAAQRAEDAYLNRKIEKSKSVIKERLQQAQISGKGDEMFDAVGAEEVAKLDDLVTNPAVRLEPVVAPEGAGLRLVADESAPLSVIQEVEEANLLITRIDEATSETIEGALTVEARAQAETELILLEDLASGEYAVANDVKARRLEAVGTETPTYERSSVSDAVEPCALAAAAIYGLAPCITNEAADVVSEGEQFIPDISTVVERPNEGATIIDLEQITDEPLPELENHINLPAENIPTAFQRQIQEGKDLERLLDEAPLSDELYRKATLDSHGALKLPVFENNLPPKYTLYEISMDRNTLKGLNGASYELGTNAISTQHQKLVTFAKEKNLPVTTLQKTTYIAVPTDSPVGIDEVLNAVEEARAATSGVTKQPVKLRVGIADNADTLMETRLRTKRSLEFTEQNKVPPTKYEKEVTQWYEQLPVEQKAEVNDIFTGYDQALKNEFAALDRLKAEGKTEEYKQKIAQLAVADMQDAKFSNLPTVKKYQSDAITGVREGDAVVSTDGIKLGQKNKEDVLTLTQQNLPEGQLAAQLGKKIDNSINQVNDVIKDTYFQAVDNVNLLSTDTILKYDEIAAAAKYPGGSITNTDDLKNFLKWEFENKGRFRGGDETFMTFRKEVLDVNPDFARTLQNSIRFCENCGYDVRVGLKEVAGGESYAQAIGAADKATIASKQLGDIPVVVDRFGNAVPITIADELPVPNKLPVPDTLLKEVEAIELPSCSIGGSFVGQAAAAPCPPTGAPKTIDDLVEGEKFRVRSKSGNSYAGSYLHTEGGLLNFETGEETKRFFGLFGTKKETGTLRVELLDQSSIIREGDQIRITSNNGIPYVGRYAGEDAEFFRIKYPNGDTLRFKKSDFNLDTIIGEGDQVTLRSKSGNSYSGQYVSEADGYVVLRDESGNAFRLRSELVDKTSITIVGPLDPAKEVQLNINSFLKLSRTESIGGNAGPNNVALNFWVDAQSGRILENGIGNFQHLPASIPERGVELTLIVNVKDGKVVEVYGNEKFLQKYREALVNKPLYEELSPVNSEVVNPCNIAAAAIHGLAPCQGGVAKIVEDTAAGVETPAAEISGVRIKEPRYLESEPLLLEQRVVETPSQQKIDLEKKIEQNIISLEISTIKNSYIQQKIDLETIIQRHPSVKVQSADVAFTGKLGEGTVGIVYEADLLGVGDNLAFKTAKAVPGERTLRGNLAGNIDGLFGEFEKAREACKLVPCPQYYGIYKVDGIPYLVSDKVKGRHFFDLTDEEIVQYFTPKKISSFKQDLARAIDASWNPSDLQAMVLTEPHLINGKQYQAGDILFVDVADWHLDKRITASVKQEFLDSWIDSVINQPKMGAEQALAFKRDFAPAAKIIETASPEELIIALDAANYDVTAEVLAYLRPRDKQLRRMYELDIDPLLVSQKIPEAKAARFKSNLPRAAEAVEDANIEELRRALDSAGYEATPDVLNIITDRENRLRLMYVLDIDAEEVARAIPGTHFEQPFEIAGEKYLFDARKGTWVQEREEGVMKTLFGDQEVKDSVITAALDQARVKAGLPKAQPAVIQTGENTFEIAGKEYYLEDGVWKQKRNFWFDKKLDEVEDSGILSQLDETRSKMIEEGLLPLPETKLESCTLAAGAIIGGAIAGPCLPLNLPSQEVVFKLPPAELPEPRVVTTVQGYEGTVSNLYDSIAPENVEEIFQNKLEFLGEDIYGGKAVAYIQDDGTVKVVFLTESDKTHHRHALGTIIGNEKGDLVYNGQYDNYLIADLPNRAFGFEFQYDQSKGKIIGIQASSQITNLQKGKGITGWKLSDQVVEYVEQEMLEKIDLDLIDESLVDRPMEQWVDNSRLPVSSSS